MLSKIFILGLFSRKKKAAPIEYMTSCIQCPRCDWRTFSDVWATTHLEIALTCTNCGVTLSIMLPDDIDSDGGICGCGVVNDEEGDYWEDDSYEDDEGGGAVVC